MIWRNYHGPMQFTLEELMAYLEYLNEMEVE
jgi:hypothetical protein